MWDPYHQVLFEVMLNTPFKWENPMDENRAYDGLEFRSRYTRETQAPGPVPSGPCSVLEVLLGLAERMADILYDPEDPDLFKKLFYELVDNLGIAVPGLNRTELSVFLKRVQDVKRCFYPYSGPELWYAMHSYLGAYRL